MEIDWSKVTRLEVIGDGGRLFGLHDAQIEPSLQDDGRTLKVFVTIPAKREPRNGQ
jgi:hypothetical protein